MFGGLQTGCAPVLECEHVVTRHEATFGRLKARSRVPRFTSQKSPHHAIIVNSPLIRALLALTDSMVTATVSSMRAAGLPTSSLQQTRCLSRSAPVKWASRCTTPCKPTLHFSCETPLQRGARAVGATDQSSAATIERSIEDGLRDQEPGDARSAIALGLRLYEDSQFELALDLFSRALTLPGTGLKRFRHAFPPNDMLYLRTQWIMHCFHDFPTPLRLRWCGGAHAIFYAPFAGQG